MTTDYIYDLILPYFVGSNEHCSQIQLESGCGDEVFINTDQKELMAIRDMINKILSI